MKYNKKYTCKITTKLPKNIKYDDLVISSDGKKMIVLRGTLKKSDIHFPWPKDLIIHIPNAAKDIMKSFIRYLERKTD